jgi:hypothetical protein
MIFIRASAAQVLVPARVSDRTHRSRWPEDQSAVADEFYRLTGDRISTAPGFAIHNFEGAKTNDMNAPTLLKVLLDYIKKQVDQT